MNIPRESFTFDDVLLEPRQSDILPRQADLRTSLTPTITLNIPIISAAMDTVTESDLAIALAQEGGIGIIHYNLSIKKQVQQVRLVKKYESWMVTDPIIVSPEAPLSTALELMSRHNISGIPVVSDGEGRLVGILTNRDVRFASDLSARVYDHMTKENLITVPENVSVEQAKTLLHAHRIEKLIVVDDSYCCIGLITVKDLTKSQMYPGACKDEKGCLRVGAAVGVSEHELERGSELIKAGVDLLVVDTAHGHSQKVLSALRNLRMVSNQVQLVAGNVATAEGAKSLIDQGADAIKVGIGPGAICTTRVVAGIGVPQLTAIMDTVKVCQAAKIPLISDGGIKYSGDIAKALAAGADSVMLGGLLAGAEESPGKLSFYEGRAYKDYIGMGAVRQGGRSSQRYMKGKIPEGVEGRVPYKGPLKNIIEQLTGGVRLAMGYTGSRTIKDLQKNARFIKVTNAGLREGHVHDVQITNEASNYVPDDTVEP